jgi:hypothetical protein
VSTGTTNPLSGYNPPAFGAPSTFDVITVAGQTCPGICVLSGFKRKWKMDKKKGKGANGVDLTQTGKDVLTGTITFYVWTALQLVLWEGFRPLFKYDTTKQQMQAVTVFHPALADLDISALVCESLSPMLHVGKGLYSCEADMVEWSPPPKAAAVSTPTQAKAGGSGPTINPAAPAPTDPQQIKIAALLKQLGTP